MTDWNALVLAGLARRPGVWDVLPAGTAPADLCREYPSVEAAHAAIMAAGFAPTRLSVMAPELVPTHDRTSLLRFARGSDAVVIVRRHPVITASKENGVTGKILLITKLKGGAGATTTVRELAVAATTHGLRVALIDLDAQGGITRWWNRRNATGAQAELPVPPNPGLLEIPVGQVPRKAAALRRTYGLTLIDSPPSTHDAIRQVAAIADLAVIPTRPTTDDLDAVGPIVRLLRGAVDVGFVLTMVAGGARSRDAAEAHELLAKGAPVFGRTTFRVDYPRAAAAGRTAFETGGVASAEVMALWQTLADRLSMTASQQDGITSSRDDILTSGYE